MTKLTDKQTLFVHEYLVDLNATQAAIRAGYSKDSAKAIGCENLTKPDIADAITEAKAERIEKVKIDANWVLERLAAEVNADLAEIYDENGGILPLKDWPMIWRQGLVSGIDVAQLANIEDGGTITKIKISDRIKRIELIGKHIDVNAFATNVQHSGKDGNPIMVESAGDMELARRLAFILQSPGLDYATMN